MSFFFFSFWCVHWILSHCSGISPKPLCCRSLYAHCALCLLLPFMTLPEAYLFSWALKQACPYFCPYYFLFAAAHYKELCSLCWKCGRCGRMLGPWQLCAELDCARSCVFGIERARRSISCSRMFPSGPPVGACYIWSFPQLLPRKAASQSHLKHHALKMVNSCS